MCGYDGKIVGTAGIGAVGNKKKNSHRAEFGISVEREWWGLGIGRALTEACIECAVTTNYTQVERDVVSENSIAVSLYKKCGFEEYGRNPLGFKTENGYQELVLMRLELQNL